MSIDSLGALNWLAVIAGGVVYFVLGALWYSPILFGRAWQAAIGWDPDRAPPQMSPTSYVVPLIGYLGMSVAVGFLAAGSATDTIGEGVTLGVVVAIGLSLMQTLVSATFDPNLKRKWTWFWITGSYNAVGLMVVAIIVAVWR